MALLFALTFFSLTAAASSACNRTYGGQTVPYPFGFSAECPIRVTYSSAGGILLGNFPIRNFTSKAVNLAVPAICDRPSSEVAGLFGRNYAMAGTNALFLSNCSSNSDGGGSAPAISPECNINTTIITERLNLGACNPKNGDIRCYSGVGEEQVLSKNQFEEAMMNCGSLFTVVRYGSDELNQTMLVFGTAEVGWWLDGECRCAANASCTHVAFGNVSRKGFRCKCLVGFDGDGFSDGDGCRPIGDDNQIQQKHQKHQIPVLVIVPLVALAALSACILFIRCMRKRTSTKLLYEQSKIDDIDCAESLLFDLSALQDATANFHEENKLGEGGFGAVYKGVLPDRREIAVKRLAPNSWQGLTELKNELVLVAKLQHRNLVSLLGVCLDREKMIVYEFVPNGSLDTFLHDPARREQLHWHTRFRIICGIARGLQYLHNESRLTVVHRDLKASNILLDANMNPKIADFGLSRLFLDEQTHKSTSRIVGTFGYMAPEYVMHGQFSVKSDVFSFGVLVLEIITGRKNCGFQDAQHSHLLSYTWKNWINGTILELLDRSASGEDWPRNEVLRCIQIGLLCVEENPNDRPDISTAVLAFSSSAVTLRAPSRPAFWTGTRSLVDLNAETFQGRLPRELINQDINYSENESNDDNFVN